MIKIEIRDEGLRLLMETFVSWAKKIWDRQSGQMLNNDFTAESPNVLFSRLVMKPSYKKRLFCSRKHTWTVHLPAV
jgi:hypothetical protein